MTETVWQHETDGDTHDAEPTTPAVNPLETLQRFAASTDQPAAQAAAVALDALVKFLVTAAPAEAAAQALQTEAVRVEALQAALPVAAPLVAEPAPVAVAPQPEPEPESVVVVADVPVASIEPEPAPPEPQGELVELWPSDPVADDAALVRSAIDDALMPRSLSLGEQMEFTQDPPEPTPQVVAPPVPPAFTPAAVAPASDPVVPEPVPVAPPVVAAAPVVPVVAPPAPVAPAPVPVAPVVPVQVVAPLAPVAPPVAPAPVAAAAPVAAPQPVAQTPAVPFWKRELSLGKKKKEKLAPAVPVTTDAKPAAPFWKRELSFGRKPKSAAPAVKPAKGSKVPKPSFLRRELKIDLAGLANKPIGHQEGTTEGLEKLVGLRIGSSQLAAAVVSNNGTAELERLVRSPLRPGLVVDGEVHDADGLASALKSFFSANKLPRRGVRIGVATNRIGVRVMEVPALDDEKAAANAIRFHAQEVLPFALSEAVVDHVDLGEGPNDTRRVLIAFAHRGLIDQYVEACKRAKLKLAGIDFDAFALLRAVTAKRAEGDEAKSALVALAIGHERTIFAVSDGEVCEFTRVLDWGGSALDTALASALEVTPEAAEHLKKGLSLSGEVAHADLTPEQGETARRAVRDSLQLLARELVASLQFYQSRTGSLDIGDVLVTGGGAGLAGLDAELTRMLGVPVRTADPFAGVTVAPGVVVPEQSGSLAIAVGLAIEEQH